MSGPYAAITVNRRFRYLQPRPLIVISCSAAKRLWPRKPIAAMERYDGVFFKVIRKAQREGRLSRDAQLAIISAKYGLIGPQTKIPFYDQRLNKQSAELLRDKIQKALRRILQARRHHPILINVGRDYAAMISGMEELKAACWAQGPIGVRAAILKQWLSYGQVAPKFPIKARIKR